MQWLSEEMVLLILSRATEEISQQTYNMNKVSRQSLKVLLTFEPPQNSIKELQEQIINWCIVLSGMPKYFIDLLNNEQILSHSQILTINSKNHLVLTNLLRDLAQLNQNKPQMPNYMLHKAIFGSAFRLANLVSQKIVQVYGQCSSLFRQNLKDFTEQIKGSKIMNNFLLFKLFREIAEHFEKICRQKLADSVFRNCEQVVFDDFFQFLINKFQAIKLFHNKQIVDTQIFLPNQLLLIQRLQKNAKIKMELKQALNSEGRFSIFIKNTSQSKQVQKGLNDYLLVLDETEQPRLINCKVLRKQWFVVGEIKTKLPLSQMAKDYILEGQQHFNNLIKGRQQAVSTMIMIMHTEPLEMHTNANGIVGRSLFMMKRYSGINSFLSDLSRRAVLMKSMEELILQLPILGYMLLAGTFSLEFYRILTNKFATDQRKLKDMMVATFGATTTVGSSLLGAITGQALIPIPIFGALVGGVIGGFIGDKGSKHVNSWMTRNKFLKVIEYLRAQQIDKRYWVWNERLYDLLQIKQEQVRKAIPKSMQDFVFATVLAFILICFYESKRLAQYNKEKAKSQGPRSGLDNFEIVNKNKSFEQSIKAMNCEQDYESDFDLMRIIVFLQQKNTSVYEHFVSLEKSILIFLQNIIS